jgi:AbiV family abortive infection protein
VNKKLDTYRGKLSPAQVAAGMNAAANNARRLCEDAATLFAAGRFSTAASIAILSIEEAGKLSILRTLAVARSDSEIADAWKDYRSHTRKNVAWLLPQLAAAGARKLDDLRPLFDEASDHPFVLDQIKQLGFYTDCLGKAHWAVPTETIEKDLAEMLVEVAQVLARDEKHTEEEVKLWVKHVGPVWKKDPAWMKQALVSWYAALQEAGLAAKGDNKMEQFVRHGLQRKEV